MSTEYSHMAPSDACAAITAEEEELDFVSFTLEDAWAVGVAIRNWGLDNDAPLVIAVDLGGQRAFHSALQGSAALNAAWLDRKFRTVAHYGHASLAVRYDFAANRSSFRDDSLLDPRRYTDAGGAFPIRVEGTLVGAVGVSGLEMHEDHALAVTALRAHKRGTGSMDVGLGSTVKSTP
ncbi:heme-binding protein [Microbacterium sp. K24]|uniref:heme-degrading domain-containing protein n=1 Tax=Microbacterium sp. K24 TaxID=2305446 RepID=UPI00197B49C1|nr:heme-binding protein [Microbacterium sp. K24]